MKQPHGPGEAVAGRRLTEREQLVHSLQRQRRAIAEQLQGHAIASSDYPRSLTMRMLTKNPGMLVQAAFELYGLWRSGHGRSRQG